MPACPSCKKPVYFSERVFSIGKDWHKVCFKCENCTKPLDIGGHIQHGGKPYCKEATCVAAVAK